MMAVKGKRSGETGKKYEDENKNEFSMSGPFFSDSVADQHFLSCILLLKIENNTYKI